MCYDWCPTAHTQLGCCNNSPAAIKAISAGHQRIIYWSKIDSGQLGPYNLPKTNKNPNAGRIPTTRFSGPRVGIMVLWLCSGAGFLWLDCHTWAPVVTHVVELLIKTLI